MDTDKRFERLRRLRYENMIATRIRQIRGDDAMPMQRLIKMHGMEIGLQYLPGDMRHGKKMEVGYGYIRNHVGEDGMALDVYVGPSETSKKAFMVQQLKENGDFDENKVMLGFDTIEDAKAAYIKAIAESRFGKISPITFAKIHEYRRDSFAEASLMMAGYKVDPKRIEDDFLALRNSIFPKFRNTNSIRDDAEPVDTTDYIVLEAVKSSEAVVKRWADAVQQELKAIVDRGGTVQEAIDHLDTIYELPTMVKSSKEFADALANWQMVAHLSGQNDGMKDLEKNA
jgi:Inorganic Pyrophosphatase